MKIKIPLNGLNEKQKIIQLKELNIECNYEIIESNDDYIHIDKINTNDNIFVSSYKC